MKYSFDLKKFLKGYYEKTVRARLKEQFQRGEPERVYRAVVHGVPAPEKGTWRDSLAWDADDLVQRKTTPADSRSREAVSRVRGPVTCRLTVKLVPPGS